MEHFGANFSSGFSGSDKTENAMKMFNPLTGTRKRIFFKCSKWQVSKARIQSRQLKTFLLLANIIGKVLQVEEILNFGDNNLMAVPVRGLNLLKKLNILYWNSRFRCTFNQISQLDVE